MAPSETISEQSSLVENQYSDSGIRERKSNEFAVGTMGKATIRIEETLTKAENDEAKPRELNFEIVEGKHGNDYKLTDQQGHVVGIYPRGEISLVSTQGGVKSNQCA
ncbi:MAG: hypothetical protein Q9217_002151 [Psora testacea]